MTLPSGTQRRIPRDSTAGLVPLFPAKAQGDARQGLIRVPVELTHARPHSEQRRQFTAIVDGQIKIWLDWLAKKGWTLTGTPKVQGPFNPPSRDARTAPIDEGMKHYFVAAHFQREYPLYLPYDAAAWFRDEAYKYGEEPLAEASVDSDQRRTVKTILNPERVDPLDFAAKRRERLGITNDDWTQQPISPEEGRGIQVV